MRIAYQDNIVTLYNGHFLDGWEACGAADTIVTDPPYGETKLSWDTWPDGWPSAIAAMARPTATMWCFGSFRMFLTRVADFTDWRLSQEIIWEKHNGSGFATDRFKRVHEIAAFLYRQGTAWRDVWHDTQYTYGHKPIVCNRRAQPLHTNAIKASTYMSHGERLMRSVIKVPSCNNKAIHPTEKPEGILAPLICYACPPNGLVFDPFAGSASTLAVARALGRRAVGFEIDPEMCKKAADRLGAM